VRRRTLWVALVVALGLGCTASTALAYTGGPFVAEVLGFDRASQRIYHVLHHYSDAGDPSTLWYFPLTDSIPWEPVRGPWTGADGVQSRPDSLRCQLEPLWPAARSNVRLQAEVLRADTMTTPMDTREARRLLGVDLRGNFGSHRVEVVTFCSPRVEVAGVFYVPQQDPGRWCLLVVLAYVGDWYGCEEAQVPLLVSNQEEPVRHLGEWR
jgi:hypothetical protein